MNANTQVQDYLSARQACRKVDITPEEFLQLEISHDVLHETFVQMVKAELMKLPSDSYEYQVLVDLLEIRSWRGIEVIFFPREDEEQMTIFDLI